jgi:hypothetical protein
MEFSLVLLYSLDSTSEEQVKSICLHVSFQQPFIIKVKSCPCALLIKHYTIKLYGGLDI